MPWERTRTNQQLIEIIAIFLVDPSVVDYQCQFFDSLDYGEYSGEIFNVGLKRLADSLDTLTPVPSPKCIRR